MYTDPIVTVRQKTPLRLALLASLISAAALASGCPGSAKDFGILFPGDGGRDGAREGGIALIDGASEDGPSTPDGSAPKTDGVASDAPGCAAKGVFAKCDPTGNTGCGQGACYIVKTDTTGCVCPAGQGKAEDACNTTVDCAPGLVCAGTKAPGICRTLCDPSNASCGATLQCTKIRTFQSLGFCQPRP